MNGSRLLGLVTAIVAACGGQAAQSTPATTATGAAPATTGAAAETAATATPAPPAAMTATAGASTAPTPSGTGAALPVPSPTPPSGSPFAASGTFRGAQFSLSCTRFGSSVTEKDVAMQTSQGFVLLSCHDAHSGLQVNVTVAAPAVGEIVPKHSSEGSRIAITAGAGGEFISTSDGDNKGKISVTTWDAATHHIAGTYEMSWPKDSSGQGGSLQGSFDVSNLPAVQ